jgi:hypothetical protein
MRAILKTIGVIQMKLRFDEGEETAPKEETEEGEEEAPEEEPTAE